MLLPEMQGQPFPVTVRSLVKPGLVGVNLGLGGHTQAVVGRACPNNPRVHARGVCDKTLTEYRTVTFSRVRSRFGSDSQASPVDIRLAGYLATYAPLQWPPGF